MNYLDEILSCIDWDMETSDDAKLQTVINKIISDERERCAKIADEWECSIYPIGEDIDYETASAITNSISQNIAYVIRNVGSKPNAKATN